ncbi:MAG: type II secretion system protein [Vampirovibrio sp.]|nr:type II secretion system protein [Vampirovibrio sp.]
MTIAPISHAKNTGFTLTELLMSLGVLGLIASLTIPSVVNAMGNSANKAFLKESINIISTVAQAGVLSGELTPDDAGEQYMIKTLNANNVCPTGACPNTWLSGSADETSATGAILQNKVELTFINRNETEQVAYVDVNGNSQQPNQIGEDVFIVCYNATQEVTNGACGRLNPAQVAPDPRIDANVAGYSKLVF